MILLMDHSKMGESNYYHVFDFEEIDVLVTDRPLPGDMAERCAAAHVEVLTP